MKTARLCALGDYLLRRSPWLSRLRLLRLPDDVHAAQQGVVGALRMLSFNPGRDYEVVFVSFDDRDTPEMATAKKRPQ